jgi:transcriptional regulator with XRE-family HTH domain
MQAGLNLAMARPVETLAQRLSRARKKRGLSQTKLAELSGLKQSDISKLETGNMLKTTGMARLARALLVSDLWLELGEGPEPDWGDHSAPHRADEPQPPPADFSDRHAVSDSDWALLQDLKDAMASPQLAKQVTELRAELAALKGIASKMAEELYRRRIEEAQHTGGHAGGMSVFGGLDEPAAPAAPAEKKRGGHK